MTTLSPLDRAFLAAFIDRRLSAAEFDHRAHVRAAWAVLQCHDLSVAIEMICTGIRELATQFGAAEKYNRTLSEAIVRLMASRDAATLGWSEFVGNNPELFSNASAVLSRYYSTAVLQSADAKASFIPPDRMPLPPCPTHHLQP